MPQIEQPPTMEAASPKDTKSVPPQGNGGVGSHAAFEPLARLLKLSVLWSRWALVPAGVESRGQKSGSHVS